MTLQRIGGVYPHQYQPYVDLVLEGLRTRIAEFEAGTAVPPEGMVDPSLTGEGILWVERPYPPLRLEKAG